MPALQLLRQVFGKSRTSEVRGCSNNTRPYTFRVILGLVLVGCAWAAYRLGSSAPSPASPAAPTEHEIEGLVVAAAALDLGEPWESTRFNWTLPIENRRTTEVRIDDFVRSCTCLDIEPRSLVIPPGETREVRLTLDMTERERTSTVSAQTRDFHVNISPRTADVSAKGSLKWWKLHGRIRSAIALDRQVVDFGRPSDATQPLPSQKVLIRSLVPLERLTASSSLDTVLAKVDPLADAPGRFELTISPTKLPIGPIALTITMVPHTAEGQVLPGKPLTLKGHIVSDFQASPPAVLLGARNVGETAEEIVTLHSLSGQRFEVTAITARGEGLRAERTNVESSEGPQFVLNQTILKAGQYEGQVVLRVRAAGGKEVEVVVPVSYLGLTTIAPRDNEEARP